MPQIDDHPLRYRLANELHARPFPTMKAPCRAAFIALKQKGSAVSRDHSLEWAHLLDLLDRHGAPHPQPNATHYYGQIGKSWLKWEQHTEFVTYTIIHEGLGMRPFDEESFSVFPSDWLQSAPGVRVTSALFRVEKVDDSALIDQSLREWFVPESLAVSSVLDGACVVAGDFRIDPSGHQRFAVFANQQTGERRIGRIIQRLCEIETYKAMSMLGFAQARDMSAPLNQLGDDLTQLVEKMGKKGASPEKTLNKLLSNAAQLETLSARCAFRFSATVAYEAIVNQRIQALREQRFLGRQTFAEFMMRRYEPAMRTVQSARERLEAMINRSIRASNLLRTQVDVTRSAQNQALLSSMDQRSDQQLHLQRTVEGLSVVAISYYAVSLVSYLLYPVAEYFTMSKGMMSAIVTLPVVMIVWYSLRRLHQKLK